MARVGVFVCECGTNIKDRLDVPRVLDAMAGLEDVVVAEPFRLLCSPDGRSYLEERIRQERLDHVVIAACSPREHQQTFMGVLERAGANPYLMQLVNVREQCAWVTEDREGATRKAIRMLRGAVARVRHQAPLARRDLAIRPDVLVLGGGLAGMEACLSLAGAGRKVYLVEREPELGGLARHLRYTYPDMRDVPTLLQERIERLRSEAGVEVLTSHRLERLVGFLGNFEATVRPVGEGPARELKVGALVLATGARPLDPVRLRGYGLGEVERVHSALELERMLADGFKDGPAPRSLAMVHCVGREVKGYCSEVCCSYGLKLSRQVKRASPGTDVVHLYRDLCIPGKDMQSFCQCARAEGVRLVRCAGVRVGRGEAGPRLELVEEGGSPGSMEVDMVVLLPASEPQADAGELAQMLGISQGREGFFARQHAKLGPVASDREGVLIAGSALGPKGLSEALVQAQAAAGKVLASLVPGRRIEIEAKTSSIEASICQGCKSCIAVCPFGAIVFDDRRKVAVVNEAICRGCGSCAAACPSGAATVKHFTYDQIYQEIAEALR